MCFSGFLVLVLSRVCEADARPLPKQRVKGHKPDVANKINNTNNASKASNASPNNTNAQASCNALGTMQARPAIQSSCTSSNNKHNGKLHDTQPGPQRMHKAMAKSMARSLAHNTCARFMQRLRNNASKASNHRCICLQI